MAAITQQTDPEMSEEAPFHFLDVAVLIADTPLTCCAKKKLHINFRLCMFTDLKEMRGVVP